MKILVTGAAGFIGFHTIKKLVANDHEVVGLDNINDYYGEGLKFARHTELGIVKRRAEKFNTLMESIKHPGNLNFIRLNLEDRASLTELL